MLTEKQKSFIEQFDAVARAFNPGFECHAYTSTSARYGAEITVVVMPAGTGSEVVNVKGHTPSEVITALTNALRAKFPAEDQVAKASDSQRRRLLEQINHPLFPQHQKSAVLLSLCSMSSEAAENKIAAVAAQLLAAEEALGKYVVRGEAQFVPPVPFNPSLSNYPPGYREEAA